MNEDKTVENDLSGDRRKVNYFAQYIFPIVLITILGIFLTFMQGRVSSADVDKSVTRLETGIQKNSTNIDKLTESVNRLVGYLEAQKDKK